MNNVVVYGAQGIQTRRTCDYLKEKGKNIVAFADGNYELWGKLIGGIKCIRPDELPYGNSIVVIAAAGRSTKEICQDLTDRHIVWVTIGQLVINYEYKSFQQVYELLDDCYSQKTLSAVTAARYMLRSELCSLVAEPMEKQYFSFWNQLEHGIYVDMGAYTGDTIERYLATNLYAKRIYAFEPDPRFFSALQCRIGRLAQEWALDISNFVLSSNWIGANRDVINNGSVFANGSNEITDLDSFLDGEQVDFIKADIEGMELDMLHGASKTILTYKPKLAICIYHSIWDHYEIPLYLHKLVPEYKMAVRHYSSTLSETVLYCSID